jgi:hypothetical protein
MRGRAGELRNGVEAALSPAGGLLRGRSVARGPDTLVSVFARRVWETPDAVAFTTAEGIMTYAMLDARATAIAVELAVRGALGAIITEPTLARVADLVRTTRSP